MRDEIIIVSVIIGQLIVLDLDVDNSIVFFWKLLVGFIWRRWPLVVGSVHFDVEELW